MSGRSERRAAWSVCPAAALILLASCAVGPDFHSPAAPAHAGYAAIPLPARIDGAPTTGGDPQALAIGRDIQGQWWTLFASPTLNALIDQALRHNPSLQAAQATLLQARETARAQAGGLFPTLSGAAGVTHQREASGSFGNVSTAESSATGGISPIYNLYNASVSLSYTLDLWGGVRRGIEQQQALAEAQQFALEASYLTLTANIVTAAVTEASLKAQIGATLQVVAAEQSGLTLVAAQLAAGAVTRAEQLQQQAQLQTTLATLPPLQSQLAQERNLLATYVGDTPDQFTDPHFDLAQLNLPAELPVSLPSALVAQRPDIRQSAATLHAQTAAVGVATAALLPQVTLTGSYGTDALKLAQLFTPQALAYSVAAQATQTLFEGGTLVHQRRAAIAAMQAAAAQYQATVIAAFANVSDALLALQFDATALQVALEAAQSAHQSLALLEVQYRAGSINNLAVLTAQQTEQTALITLARAQAARYADTAALFQALGGGWWNRADIDPKVARCCGLLQ